jgi:hypothetical protein
MVDVIIVVREVGRLKPDYSLKFDLPEVPAVGSYVSINRPDVRDPLGEDMIVRKVWWRLFHPVTDGVVDEDQAERAGVVKEIFVECEPALGPYSSSSWQRALKGRRGVEEFEVERFRFPELPDDGPQ